MSASLIDRVAALGLRDAPWRIGATQVSNLLEPHLSLAANDHLPVSRAAFDTLREYSTSLPTGTTEGKVWKCRRRDGWFLGRYGKPYPPSHEHAGSIPISWWPLIIEGAPARWPGSVRVPLRRIERGTA